MSGDKRAIRRLAFQALFQLDARPDSDPAEVRAALHASAEEGSRAISETHVDRAMDLALAAYKDRRASDEAVRELAPTWPAQRQPAVDRAILRLAHHEMHTTGPGATPPKIAVNEAVELAKEFSTEKSPAFVNGVLDKLLKRVLAERGPAAVAATEVADADGAGAEGDAGAADTGEGI
jgi:N utilization substance protein B